MAPLNIMLLLIMLLSWKEIVNFNSLKPGKSVEGSQITAFRSEVKGDKYIYLLAGVHGDEVEGVYVLNSLFDHLKRQEDLEIPIIIIPILNIDGYRSGTRVNSNGVDLNRNCPSQSWSSETSEEKYFPGRSAGSEPENQFLFKLMDKFAPGIILSFHSWKPIINYNGDCRDLAIELSKFNQYQALADIGYPTPGSLGDFGPEKYNSPVITYECPLLNDRESLEEIWQENSNALSKLFSNQMLKRFL